MTTSDDEAKLREAIPAIITELVVMTGRPVRLVWTTQMPVAGTDCVATVWMNPRFFTGDNPDLGYGIIYHEGGHILWSPDGVKLLTKAKERGGELLKHIINILLDRRDDRTTAKRLPGVADRLRRRLTTICSLGFADEAEEQIAQYLDQLAKDGTPSKTRNELIKKNRTYAVERIKLNREQERLRILGAVKPRNVADDFFMSAKWGKRAHTPEGHRAKRYLGKHPFTQETSHEAVLQCAERIIEILCDTPTEQDLDRLDPKAYRAKKDRAERCRQELDGQMSVPMSIALRLEHGEGAARDPHNQRLDRIVHQIIVNLLQATRKRSIEGVIEQIKLRSFTAGQGPIFRPPHVAMKGLPADAKYATAYEKIRTGLLPEVQQLVERLRNLDSPTEYTLYGQDEGELDVSEAARIATHLSGVYTDTVEERDIDAEIHLAIDTSGSMTGTPLDEAKRVAVLFSEAILALGKSCDGRLWAYDSTLVQDLGPPRRDLALPALQARECNSDTDMLGYVGQSIVKSKRRQKIVLVVCDTGPDDPASVRRVSMELEARGIIVIHLLVGVHATPMIYPHEVLFATMSELVKEFGTLLTKIFHVLH